MGKLLQIWFIITFYSLLVQFFTSFVVAMENVFLATNHKNGLLRLWKASKPRKRPGIKKAADFCMYRGLHQEHETTWTMPTFERWFKDKYAGSPPESICWPNSVRLAIFSYYKIWFPGRKIGTIIGSTGCLSWRGSPFICLLSPLTHSFAPHCSFGLCALLRSFACWLSCFAP